MLHAMKSIFAILATIAILSPLSALAAGPLPIGPNKGVYGDWTAAAYGSGASKICYAFTKPQSTSPVLARRGLAMLTVTERHGSHDEVSVTPGYIYPAHAVITMQLGRNKLPFYVQDNVAFTDAVSEALTGFAAQSITSVTATGPRGKKLTDSFSLTGFSAAYKAIEKACP
jgi:hypothetical protein